MNNTILRKIAYFFPFQLLFVHFKKNVTILVFWAVLFGFVTKQISVKYGIPYLFLDPEYMERVDFFSYAIMGFALGGFIMAFNISSYIRNSFRFPFLATLSNPFLKYCVNNAVLPFLFLVIYIIQIALFQSNSEYTSTKDILIDIGGLLIGLVVFILMTIVYVKKTNKDIYKMFKVRESDHEYTSHNSGHVVQKVILRENLSWKKISPGKDERDWHVETYLNTNLRIKLARGFEHYDKVMLKSVFKQNHKAAALLELLATLTLLTLGFFREYTLFLIPAGASILLLLTMMLMVTSALYTWIRGWTNIVFLGVFLLLNFLFQYEGFNFINKVFGLNYSAKKAEYSNVAMLASDEDTTTYYADIRATERLLKNWKAKNSGDEYFAQYSKPKLIMINCSGGGSRSAMWVVHALQHADSVLNGELLKQTVLITGSSGGLAGAAYLRELYLQKNINRLNDFYNKKYAYNAGKDILNPITLTIATNDLFLRLQKYHLGNKVYTKDRGYAFEHQYNKNLEMAFTNRRLMDYYYPEKNALIPMLIAAPTIINDGRRLLISSQGISYLSNRAITKRIESEFLTEAIEFRRMFNKQDADSLLFTSAIRMSASFPYISPIVSLPSTPRMDVMDAGIRDNYGVITSVQFLYTFRDWIAENTSGVIILQLRDRDKGFVVEENPLNSIVQTFSSPIGSFYNNLFHMQDYHNDILIKYSNSWFAGSIDIVNLELRNLPSDRISLSWHLTTREKQKVINSIYEPNNQEALKKLRSLLGQ